MKKNMLRFVLDNIRLQKGDFLVLPLVITGVSVVFGGLFGTLYAFIREEELITFGVTGVMALAVGMMLCTLMAVARIWVELRIGVHMSQTRGRMFAASLVLGLLGTAETLVLVPVFNGLWRALAAYLLPGRELRDVVALMPLWSWFVCLVLPTALGSLFGALLLRYGRRAGWVIYLGFMLTCITPSLTHDRLENSPAAAAVWAVVQPILPLILLGVAAVSLAAAWLIVRRAAITE